MFGYVNVYKPELKVKDYVKYKAYYCGLCHVLKQEYGMLGRMALSYDMAFLIAFLTSVYEPVEEDELKRCIVHPLEKRPVLINEITKYAAAMNIVLMYYKFGDDWVDEKKPAALAGFRSLRRAYLGIKKEYPDKCITISRRLKKMSRLEKKKEYNLDRISGCFGSLMEELFAYKHDIWEDNIRHMAFYLGKFIYLMDAYDDLEQDIVKKRYNPFMEKYLTIINEYGKEEGTKVFKEECNELLTVIMSRCSEEFEKLPCVENTEILKNILYVGVWNKFDKKERGKYE